MRTPCLLAAVLLACGQSPAVGPVSTRSDRLVVSQGQQMQGQQMQGQQMQGQQMQGTALGTAPAEVPVYQRYSGWLVGWSVGDARVVEGRVEVTADGRTVTGADLVGAWVPADQGGTRVWTQITSAQPDPTYADGSTWLYGVDLVSSSGTHTPLCGPDANGVSAAIPVAAIFDTLGNRVESTTQFTFACTLGVAAKCIRWGYRPWLGGGSSEFTKLHWACTRMARADYCGNGKTWTQNGTVINLWDRAPAPGPFNSHGSPPATFVFEAGWTTHGAVCLSKQRWVSIPPQVAADCPNQLIAPGASTGVATVCDTEDDTQLFDNTTQLFNESQLNVK